MQAVFSCSNLVRALVEPTMTGNSYGTIHWHLCFKPVWLLSTWQLRD
jgi:hypothetical protein